MTNQDQGGESSRSLLDCGRLREISEGDVTFERMLLETFLSDTAQRVQAIKDALKAGDQQAWRRQTHALKGTSANIGAMALNRHVAGMESVSCNEQRERAVALMRQLSQACDELRAWVAAYLAR